MCIHSDVANLVTHLPSCFQTEMSVMKAHTDAVLKKNVSTQKVPISASSCVRRDLSGLLVGNVKVSIQSLQQRLQMFVPVSANPSLG